MIQIGNREDFGITDKDFDVSYWRKLKKAGELDAASKYVLKHRNTDTKVNEAIQILCEIAEEIRDNKDNMYSNILVHGLTVHCDEPNGSPHLDFRYTIFTDNERLDFPNILDFSSLIVPLSTCASTSLTMIVSRMTVSLMFILVLI